MQLDDFIRITQQIIQQNGLDDYLPTACFPAQKKLTVLEEVPAGLNVETVARAWVKQMASPGEQYFLAFRWSATAFKVLEMAAGQETERVVEVG
jgi:hypothetical protein